MTDQPENHNQALDNNDEEEEEETPWIEDADADADSGEHHENVKNNDDDDEEEEDDGPYGGLDLFSTDYRDPTDEFTVTISNKIKNKNLSIRLTGIKAKYPHLLQSTGMTLWKGSQQLCDFLVEQDSERIIQGRSVVELGAGLGLCGIVAHQLGAQLVVMTDGDTDTLANLRRNVQLNQLQPQQQPNNESSINDDPSTPTLLVKQLLWGQKIEAFRRKYTGQSGFQVVMGGDIAYAQEALDTLLETVVQLLSNDDATARFILSFAFRGGVTIQNVMDGARTHGLVCCQGPIEKGPDGDGVYVFCRTEGESRND